MKKYIGGMFLFLVLAACNGAEKKAEERLASANRMFAQGELASAKMEIDSLRALYPKEYKVLKKGLKLMREVEVAEQERTIAFCDSLLPIRVAELEPLTKEFVFEKDSVYDEIGRFVWKGQTIEKNVERCYIRAGVDEKGEMYLASVFFGKTPIEHTSVKLSTKDSLIAETATIPYDGGNNYRFDDNGMKTEVVTYKGDGAVDAVKFIYNTPFKERIKVEYRGKKPYVIYLADADRKAIQATYELAAVLNDIEKLKQTADKSAKKLAYLKGKLEKDSEDGK